MSDERERPPGWPYVVASGEAASDVWAERRRLAAAMRRVIEQVAVTDAPRDQLRRAADGLERFADSLSDHPRRTSLQSFAESANAGDVHAFVDQSPLIGLSNPISPPLRLWADGSTVLGDGSFGSAFEGPPGYVHGGFVAAAFDEVLGFAQSLSGSPGMTGTLIVRYRKPTPLHTQLRFEAGVDRIDGRKIFASARLHAEGKLTAEAEGVFVSVDRERFGELMAKREARERKRGSE